MKIAVYPGTFDPITNGHLDILKRASAMFDIVHIAVVKNTNKKTLFSIKERMEMIEKCIGQLDNVKIDKFSGLVVNYAAKVDASVIIRGLRAVSDFDYEFQMALMNRHQNENIDTIFLMSHEKNTYLSSSIIKEIASFDGEIDRFLPKHVQIKLKNKLRSIE